MVTDYLHRSAITLSQLTSDMKLIILLAASEQLIIDVYVVEAVQNGQAKGFE